jgi:hypothetical protein
MMNVSTGLIARMARIVAVVMTLIVLSFPGVGHGEEAGPPDPDEIGNTAADAPADEPQGPESKPSSYSVDCEAPCIQTENDFEVENDFAHYPTPASANSNDFYPSIESDIKVRPLDWLMFSGHIVTESVIDLEPGEDRFLREVGTYAEELNVQLLFGDVEFIAGKFHPAFGLAWEIPPGLYATDLAGDYELIEQVGAGVAYRFSALGMEHHAQASVFSLDRTILSDSLFTHRGRASLADGGAGNAEGLSSVALALDGCSGAIPKDCVDDGSWGYHIAFRYQKAGRPQLDDEDKPIPTGNEKGLVGTLYKSFELADDMRLTLFGETAYLANFEATRDNAIFFTAASILKQEPLTYSLTFTHEKRWVDRDVDTTSDLFDASIDYKFAKEFSLAGERWTLGPGYAFISIEDQDSHWFGVHLKAELNRTWPVGAEEKNGD